MLKRNADLFTEDDFYHVYVDDTHSSDPPLLTYFVVQRPRRLSARSHIIRALRALNCRCQVNPQHGACNHSVISGNSKMSYCGKKRVIYMSKCLTAIPLKGEETSTSPWKSLFPTLAKSVTLHALGRRGGLWLNYSLEGELCSLMEW